MKYVRLLCFVTSILVSTGLASIAVASTPKPADQVFQLAVAFDDEEGLELSWTIAPGYYLYRDKITVSLNGKALRVATSRGELKNDPTFGPTEIYRGGAAANVGDPLPDAGQLQVTYQGCGENTICYPPITKAIDLATLTISEPSDPTEKHYGRLGPIEPVSFEIAATSDAASDDLRPDRGLFSTILAFLAFGLLLSLTPCVFPMIPILSAMLTRSTDGSMRRSFALSLTYVLAMAAAYAASGMFAAWWGGNVQVALQTPFAIGAMSLLFVVLALSTFGAFDLQLPRSLVARVAPGPRRSGTLGGAALLGFGSALIVGPCVTPPLAAALIYASQTGDVVRGSLALFALGLGTGLPLLAFGTFGARALPKSGPWLNRIKQLFGFVFLALAIWMASRITPARGVELEWGLLLIGFGAWAGLIDLMSSQSDPKLRRLLCSSPGAVAAIYGFFLVLGAGAGLSGPTGPLEMLGLLDTSVDVATTNEFRTVTDVPALDAIIAEDSGDQRPVLIDFSAAWCTECRIMERSVFADAIVRQRLGDFRLIRADMTHFDASSKQLMQRFSVVGPPTLIFLNSFRKEVDAARIVGGVDVDEFLRKLALARRS